jgi:hypothetical protein
VGGCVVGAWVGGWVVGEGDSHLCQVMGGWVGLMAYYHQSPAGPAPQITSRLMSCEKPSRPRCLNLSCARGYGKNHFLRFPRLKSFSRRDSPRCSSNSTMTINNNNASLKYSIMAGGFGWDPNSEGEQMRSSVATNQRQSTVRDELFTCKVWEFWMSRTRRRSGRNGEAVRVILCSRSSDGVNELVVWVRVVTGRGEVTWARSFVCD